MARISWFETQRTAPFSGYRNWKMRSYPLHDHDFFEIFWIEAGHLRHQVNGTVTRLKTGSVFMIRPADYHGFSQVPGQTAVLMNISFPAEILKQLKERYFRDSQSFFWTGDALPWSQEVTPAQLGKLKEWGDELIRSPREAFHIDRFLMNVLAELSPHDDLSSGQVPPWLLRACAMASGEMTGGAEAFFRLCGRSREHVSRTMRLTMNTTPTDFINCLRMGYARHHLEMSNRDILDIALDCGLQNMSHFYDLFRRETGMTPRAYRLAAIKESVHATLPAKRKRADRAAED